MSITGNFARGTSCTSACNIDFGSKSFSNRVMFLDAFGSWLYLISCFELAPCAWLLSWARKEGGARTSAAALDRKKIALQLPTEVRISGIAPFRKPATQPSQGKHGAKPARILRTCERKRNKK